MKPLNIGIASGILGLLAISPMTFQAEAFYTSGNLSRKRDTVVPSQQEAIRLLQSICSKRSMFINRERDGKIACSCQAVFARFRGSSSSFFLNKVVYGSFTQPGTDEALVDLDGCESHAQNYGGSLLLRRSNRGWSALKYKSGLRSTDCLRFKARGGQDLLACEGHYSQMGYAYRWLEQVEINQGDFRKTTLFRAISNTADRFPMHEVRIEDWAATDVNSDGFLDLAVKVREARADTSPPNFEPGFDAHLPNPTFHELNFLFNGNSFTPTAQTAELKQRLEPGRR